MVRPSEHLYEKQDILEEILFNCIFHNEYYRFKTFYPYLKNHNCRFNNKKKFIVLPKFDSPVGQGNQAIYSDHWEDATLIIFAAYLCNFDIINYILDYRSPSDTDLLEQVRRCPSHVDYPNMTVFEELIHLYSLKYWEESYNMLNYIKDKKTGNAENCANLKRNMDFEVGKIFKKILHLANPNFYGNQIVERIVNRFFINRAAYRFMNENTCSGWQENISKTKDFVIKNRDILHSPKFFNACLPKFHTEILRILGVKESDALDYLLSFCTRILPVNEVFKLEAPQFLAILYTYLYQKEFCGNVNPNEDKLYLCFKKIKGENEKSKPSEKKAKFGFYGFNL